MKDTGVSCTTIIVQLSRLAILRSKFALVIIFALSSRLLSHVLGPQRRLLQFYRHRDDLDQHSSRRSSHSGYSPSLISGENLRAQLGIDDPDHVGLLQLDGAFGPHVPVVKLASSSFLSPPEGSVEVSGTAPSGAKCSFTEAFLRAVRLMQETADAIPEFPEEPFDVETFAPWIQTLHQRWTQSATLGPGKCGTSCKA